MNYDANHHIVLEDLPPLPEFWRCNEFKFEWETKNNKPDAAKQYDIQAKCSTCGEPVNIRKRLQVVTTGWSYGFPWGVADINWACCNGHETGTWRYETSHGTWISSHYGYPSSTCFIATAAYGTSMAGSAPMWLGGAAMTPLDRGFSARLNQTTLPPRERTEVCNEQECHSQSRRLCKDSRNFCSWITNFCWLIRSQCHSNVSKLLPQQCRCKRGASNGAG